MTLPVTLVAVCCASETRLVLSVPMAVLVEPIRPVHVLLTLTICCMWVVFCRFSAFVVLSRRADAVELTDEMVSVANESSAVSESICSKSLKPD